MRLTITRPDDWHLHVRDGGALACALAHTAQRFGRAVIMPNLKPPIADTAMARAYRGRILAALPAGAVLEPLMTLYLTDETTPAEIRRAQASGIVLGAKLYPAGATTHSQAGVTRIERLYPALEAMQAGGLVLQVHGEAVDPDVDIFDREAAFIERTLDPLSRRFPELRIVLEHATTAQAIEYVRAARPGVAATLTPQHLLYNRNALFAGGLRPHRYCLPVLKREIHRRALVDAAISGEPRFFLGTDSAPHARHAKESACGCAGIYSAHAALELYAEVFEAAAALDRLEAFASLNGPRFYRLPVNTDTVSLVNSAWRVPPEYPFGDATVVPLRAGETVAWSLAPGAPSVGLR